MNDMRLPGLGLLNSEATPKDNGADTPRDPAQAFDAVMSRFANERRTRAAQNSGPDAANGAQRNAAKTAPHAHPGGTQASAQPVARTKPETADESAVCTLEAEAADPAELVAVVAESAQLAAQNAAPAEGTNDVAAPVAANDEKGSAQVAAAALDVLAGQVNAIAGRSAEKISADTRATLDSEQPAPSAPTGTASRHATVAAKDTLRIDAPRLRPFDVARAELTQRLAEAAPAAAQTALHAAVLPSAETASQAIAAAVAGNTSVPATYSIAHTAVAAPVGSAAFTDELSQRVVVFAGQKVQRAEISVTPADLGPIAVSIEVRGQEATLAFAASSHATRAAIEDALPRLRDMLSAQGLQLAGTHVGSEPRRDPYRAQRGEKGVAGVDGVREGLPALADAPTTPIRRGVNLIDIVV